MNKDVKEAQDAYDHLFPSEVKTEHFVGFNEGKLPSLGNNDISRKETDEDFIVIRSLLTLSECATLRSFFDKSEKVNTSHDTIKLQYGTFQTGIQRASFYDKDWANSLFRRIKIHLNPVEEKDNKHFLFAGINPLIRFVHYNRENHRLIPHYDGEIKISDQIITMKTIVIYLNDADSGHTNILRDTRDIPGYKDSYEIYPIIYSQKPVEGTALIFDHEMFHESERIGKDDEKLCLVTELCYMEYK